MSVLMPCTGIYIQSELTNEPILELTTYPAEIEEFPHS